MKAKQQLKKLTSLLLLLSLIISIALSFSSCSSGIGGTETPPSAEELLLTVSAECGKEFDTVAEYFDFWDFPKFSKSKLEALERLYRTKFVSELPSPL